MAQPYVGEIRMFAGNFAPAGWMFCNGSLLPISENEVLFQVIGTTYGGDGQSTFAIPDFQGRVPIHMGNSFTEGEKAGVESVTLTVNQIPSHTHSLQGTSASAAGTAPSNATLPAAALASSITPYGTDAPNTTLSPQSVRSEEHTSELQSLTNLVCRLLLEKK